MKDTSVFVQHARPRQQNLPIGAYPKGIAILLVTSVCNRSSQISVKLGDLDAAAVRIGSSEWPTLALR